MPIYEYLCAACNSATEIIQKASDPAPESCAQCGQGPMVKQVSLSAFALKGNGWYVTDFKGGNGTKPKTDSPKQDAPVKDSGGEKPTVETKS